MADQSVVIAEDTSGGLQKIKWTWMCDSSGVVSSASVYQYNGILWNLITYVGASAATDAYDITIKDADGVDQLHGLGANRSGTVTEYKINTDGLGVVKSSKLTLAVANAGDNKDGVTILYVLDMDKGV